MLVRSSVLCWVWIGSIEGVTAAFGFDRIALAEAMGRPLLLGHALRCDCHANHSFVILRNELGGLLIERRPILQRLRLVLLKCQC